MKKQLLTTTALVAAGIVAASSAAYAQKAKMKRPYITVNGYHEQILGGVLTEENDRDLSVVDVHQETEVHFNGHAKLDNGITMLAHWELETNQDQGVGNISNGGGYDVIDEVYLIIRGSFGQITIGSEDSAGSIMLTGYSGSWPTAVGQNLTFDGAEWVAQAGGGPPTTSIRDIRLTGPESDSEKISYYTPRFAGFQLGASYIPGSALFEEENGSQQLSSVDFHDGMSAAVNYVGKFSGVGIGGGAGYSHMEAPETSALAAAPGPGTVVTHDYRAFAVAARFDFGGARFSGAWKRTLSNEGGFTGAASMFDLGARYTMGPNQFSVVGSRGTAVNTSAEFNAIIAAYSRILGPGVNWNVNLFWTDSTNAAGTIENDGLALSTAVRLNF